MIHFSLLQIGTQRFMPPQPADPTSGEYDATGPIKPCAQQAQIYGNLLGIRFEEDCLYLDIWTPEGSIPGTLPEKPLPVLVRLLNMNL